MKADASSFTRRRFLEMLGVSVAGFGLVTMTGCKTGNDADGGKGGSSSGGSSDSLVYGQGAEPRSLDPAFFDDGESAKVACNIYDGLYQYGRTDAKVATALAKSLPEISDDGLTYTIKLRENIKFQDGTAFNAEAVKKSIERQLAPNATSDMAYATFVYGEEASGTGVEKVEAPDATTVVITLRAPSTPFLKNLAMSIAAPIVSPAAIEKAGGDVTATPIGTGPYIFEKWTKSDSITLKANPNYWGDKPKTKHVVFKFIPENNTRVTALLNGECDIIDGIDLSSTKTITEGGYKLFAKDGMTLNYLAFNTESGACADAEVRRAVAQAVNVPELVKAIYGKYASVANSVMPTWMAKYDKDIKQTAFDADAAKKALAAKGITELSCITYSNPRPYNAKGGQVLAETIQGYLEKVGVKLNITTYDWTTYKNKVATDPFDFCFYGWNGDNGDPDNFMNLLADTNWSMNVSRFADADYKALIARGLAMPDGDARDDIYKQCEQMVADKQVWLLISHSQNLCGVSPKVKNFYYHPTGAVFLKDVSKEA